MSKEQEEKQLLLKDLCARLPYDVKGRVYAETTNGEYDISGDLIFFNSPFDVTLDDINTSTEEIHVIAIGNEDTVEFIEEGQTCGVPYTIDEFKPYLRPKSSMTEKEIERYHNLCYKEKRKELELGEWVTFYDYHDTIDSIDYLNSIYVDYRYLIPMGLALEAPKDMYK